ncbi:MAG: thioredoxin domain-containing protein [Bacteroidota bacterium]|nr:thioredoxin domain-containing protein [Bacteroidota bacterium]
MFNKAKALKPISVKATKEKQKTFGEILRTEAIVLVNFSAECGPCKMMKPILDELKSSIGKKAMILKLDVDKNPAVSSAYNIKSIPTLMLFKKGTIVWRESGVMQANILKQVIEQHAKN